MFENPQFKRTRIAQEKPLICDSVVVVEVR